LCANESGTFCSAEFKFLSRHRAPNVFNDGQLFSEHISYAPEKGGVGGVYKFS
jgi:hypothetical protein